MKLINNIQNVISFGVFKDILITQRSDNLITSNEAEYHSKGELYCNLAKGYFSDIFANKIEIYDYNFIKILEVYKENIIAGGVANSSEILLFSVRWKDCNENEYYTYYSSEKEELVTIPEFSGRIINENFKLLLTPYYRVSEITATELEDNTPIWQFKLPEEFKIWNDIKIVEDTLFFEARKGVIRNNNVYGLDIHTGKIKWEFHFSLEENTGFVATNVDKKTNLSYGYGGIYYQVFDPVNGRMLLSKDMTKYYEQNVQPVSWNNAIADNRLWFVSGQGENVKFGALNIETSEMEFIQDYPLENNGQFSKPVFCDGKLYLLDHYNKELHIFEK